MSVLLIFHCFDFCHLEKYVSAVCTIDLIQATDGYWTGLAKSETPVRIICTKYGWLMQQPVIKTGGKQYDLFDQFSIYAKVFSEQLA